MAPGSTANRLPPLRVGSQSEDTSATGSSTVEERPQREHGIVDGDFADIFEDGEARESSFAFHLKTLRRRRAGKQACLSFQIGCTDAALSHWESGARRATPRSLARIVLALSQLGATGKELQALQSSWASERRRRLMERIARMETMSFDLDGPTNQAQCLVPSAFSNNARGRGTI